MDEIIYLEPDEEITSVIDKIKNANSSKLGLVVPRDASLLQSVVNLKLLSREATALGKEIAVVTTDKIGRNLAAQIGLQVYNSIEEQKPIYQPPPPQATADEVIELDMENSAPTTEEVVPGVKVQHYQEKPIAWKPREKPVLKSPPIQVSSVITDDRPTVKQMLTKKDRDYKKLHKIIWPMVGIFLVLAGIATYFLLPKATVAIFVTSEDLKSTLQLSVSDKVTTPSLEQNVLPGKYIEAIGEKQGKFPATGKKNIGAKAAGNITIYNNLDSNSHNFKAGSKLSSSSKTFIAKNDFSVSGATVQNLKIVPGTASVDVEAENPGEEYNIKAGRFSILELPAAQQEAIYGESSKAMAGGMSKEVQVVSQQDYDNAKSGLLKDLQESTKKDLDSKVGKDTLTEGALIVPDPEISSTFQVDQEAAEFEMKIKLKQQALTYDKDAMQAFLIQLVQKKISSEKMVSIANNEDISLKVDKTAYDKGQMDLTANVLAKISAKIDAEKIKTAILGKKSSEATSYIQSQEGVSSVKIDFNPSWWIKKIPDFEKRVDIKIEYVNQAVTQ